MALVATETLATANPPHQRQKTNRGPKPCSAARLRTLSLHGPPLRPLRRWIRPGPEIALQRTHLEVTPEIGPDALRCGDGPRESGVVRHFMQEGSAAQRPAVIERGCPLGSVENQMNFAVLDGIDDV